MSQLKTNPLRLLVNASALSVSAASSSKVLGRSIDALSVKAIGCAMHIRIGVGAQTAVATDHYIAEGERLDLAVVEGSTLAAIAASGTGVLYISELV